MANGAIEPNKDIVFFGKTDFRNQERLFGIKRRDRRQHMYIIGKTGTGKSVFIHNLIVQDIMNGEGVCVVDPHGELVESILDKIPKSRQKDVIYFNPADTDYHIGFNVLEVSDPKYKNLVASGLMGIFTKIWSNVWSARMEYILNNAVLALLDTPGTTLLGIPRILVDKEYRQKIVANITDPVVKAFWINEFEEWQDKFRSEAIAPIQNKVGQFLSTSVIRNIVGQEKSTINIFDMMNEGKIFLVNVSKGRIGEDTSALLGAMIITKIQLSAMERVRIADENARKDFYLYVDEFQNFATDSFASVLSEARKYRLNLIVAHQYIGQLVTDTSTKVRDAIFGNVGSMVVFRVGAADAEFLEKEFMPEFVIQDIVNIPNWRIYLKLMVDGVTSRPFSAKTLPPFKLNTDALTRDEIIQISRERYALPKESIEKQIRKWSGMTLAGFEDEAHEKGTQASGNAGHSFTATGKPLYDVICSSCSKPAKVPFMPIPGKPVYCSECLEKIKAGTMQPMRASASPNQGGPPAPRSPDRSESSTPERSRTVLDARNELSSLGIEFGATLQEKPKPAPSVSRRPESDAPPRPPRETPKPAPKEEAGMSLNALKTPPKQTPKTPEAPKQKPDIAGLKSALQQALKKKDGQ